MLEDVYGAFILIFSIGFILLTCEALYLAFKKLGY
jgi:hypothetical protein